MDLDNVLAWIAIGAAASLAGMIWPFRRGALGVFANLLTGVAGALAGALLSHVALPRGIHGDSPARLLFAAVGALAALGFLHVVWTWMARRPRSA
jgi:uncharacterized membrane protein YeaQ/YmgE (transglycosylase-associated protein family)